MNNKTLLRHLIKMHNLQSLLIKEMKATGIDNEDDIKRLVELRNQNARDIKELKGVVYEKG
jgi:hypothetical protein